MSTRSRAVEAALIWDVDTLRRSREPGALSFADSMSWRRRDRDEPADPVKPLEKAAAAIEAVVWADEGDEARSLSAGLASHNDELVALLGKALLGWSMIDGSAEAIDQFVSAIEGAELKPATKARLYAKALTFAIDSEHESAIPGLAAKAVEAAPARTHLRWMLEIVAGNLINWHSTEPSRMRGRHDLLVDLPWIDGTAHVQAVKALKSELKRRAASPWQVSVTWGALEQGGELRLADMQATWAGALWIRRDLRLQYAAEMLLTSTAPEVVERAATYWATSGGDDLSRVLDYAERWFNPESADVIVRSIRPDRRSPLFRDARRNDTALALWDVISDDLSSDLIDEIDIKPDDHPTFDTARQLWTLLGLRNPQQWSSRFQDLDTGLKASLCATMTPWVAINLPGAAARSVFDAFTASFRDETSINPQAAETYSHLARHLDATLDADFVERLSRTSIARIAEAVPDLLDTATLRAAGEGLIESVSNQIEAAKRGHGGMGAHDPYRELGRIARNVPSIVDPAVRLLIDAASDAEVPTDVRMSCLDGLRLVAAKHDLPDDQIDQVEHVPLGGRKGFFDSPSRELLEATRASVAAMGSPRRDRMLTILASSRSSDERARSIAVNTLAGIPKDDFADLTTAIALGALFDPKAEVIDMALSQWRQMPVVDAEIASALSKRMSEFMRTGTRDTRSATVRTARKLSMSNPDVFSSLVAIGLEDRSWVVRRTASIDVD